MKWVKVRVASYDEAFSWFNSDQIIKMYLQGQYTVLKLRTGELITVVESPDNIIEQTK